MIKRLWTILLVLTWAGLASAEPVDELIARMQKRYNAAQTLSVRFEESYSMLGHARPPESGMLTLRKQGKMRWDYAHPAGKLFISDGKNVFLYTATDNRVEKIPLKDTEDMRAPMAFLLGRLDMKREFRDFRAEERLNGSWVEAAAKNDRVPYSKVGMLLRADGTVEELKIFGRDQSELAFKFADEKLDVAVPDGIFHFNIPAGAEVVNAVEFGEEGK